MVLDVRKGSEDSEIAPKRKYYFVELPNFDVAQFIKEHGLKGGHAYCAKAECAQAKQQRSLKRGGYTNVSIIRGGIDSLRGKAEFVHEKTAISMERQVRIAAGALVLFGCILAFAMNSAFLLLPAFVGCGLIYAGISNTCAMASLLAKMPWNK